MEHTGSLFFDGKVGWKPFMSTQRVVVRRPGFDWDASVAMAPGLRVRVHDAYIAGEGILHASLFGLVSMANQRGGGDLARGELLRFLAEAAWYPTALLPGQGVVWEPVDASQARATLTDGAVTASIVFVFGDDGLIASIRAEARGRLVDGVSVPTPWIGRFWNWERRDGLLIPLDGEVAWELPGGEMPYWRGHITRLRYEFVR